MKEILWKDVKHEDKLEVIRMLSQVQPSKLIVSDHALERMEQRKIPMQKVLDVFYHIDKAKIILLHFTYNRCTVLLRKRVSKYQDVCVCYDINRNTVISAYYNQHDDFHATRKMEFVSNKIEVAKELRLIQKNLRG